MSNQIATLYGVNAKLGAMLRGGQQTTQYLYDQEAVDSNTESVEFFVNFGSKTNIQTNLKEGKLPTGESSVLKELIFVADNPISGTIIANFFIGNQRVLKDYPIYFAAVVGLDPSPLNLNSGSNFSVRLVTNLVIPPQVTFKLELKCEAGAFADATIISASTKGVGVLFNPQTSL